MELFVSLDWLVSNLLLPWSPVLLLEADMVVEDGVHGWEHWLDVTEDQIKLFSSKLIDGSSNRPDDREYKPFLNIWQEVFS